MEFEECNTLEELAGRALSVLEADGFYALTLGLAPLENGKVDTFRSALFSTLPESFQKDYYQEEFAQIDPVFEFMASRYLPFTKSSIMGEFDKAPARGKIAELANQHRIEEALMVPLNTSTLCRGVVLFTRDSPADLQKRLKTCLGRFWEWASVLMFQAERVGFQPLQPLTPDEVGLTEREAECLSWSAQGRTNDEISAGLGISERTVRFHLVNACVKLGTNRKAQAISRAVRFGLIRL